MIPSLFYKLIFIIYYTKYMVLSFFPKFEHLEERLQLIWVHV